MDTDSLINKRDKALLKIDKKIGFVALLLCAKRMKNSYCFFAEHYELDCEWFEQKLEEIALQPTRLLEKPINFIKQRIPDSEDYPELWSTIAQDAVIILLKLYYFIDENKIEHIKSGFKIMDEALDFYMQEAEELGRKEKLVQQLYKKELEWQLELIEFLETKNHIDLEALTDRNKEYEIPTYSEIFGQCKQ